MSSLPPPNNPPHNPEKKPEDSAAPSAPAPADGAEMDTTPDVPIEESWADIPEDIMALSTDEILTRIRLIENDIKVCFNLYLLRQLFNPTAGHEIGNTKIAT
jgi:26S proteasome regulatory subunit T5